MGKGDEGGLLSESTRRKHDTQDLNEPLNTNLRGGEFVYKYRVVDTAALCRRREGENGAVDAVATYPSNAVSFHMHTGRQKAKRG